MSRSLGSIAPALSLVLLLSAGAAQALPRSAQVVPSQPAGSLNAAWEWLVELFAPVPAQDAAQDITAQTRDKAGSEMDPNGFRFVSTLQLASDPSAPQTICSPNLTTCH